MCESDRIEKGMLEKVEDVGEAIYYFFLPAIDAFFASENESFKYNGSGWRKKGKSVCSKIATSLLSSHVLSNKFLSVWRCVC